MSDAHATTVHVARQRDEGYLQAILRYQSTLIRAALVGFAVFAVGTITWPWVRQQGTVISASGTTAVITSVTLAFTFLKAVVIGNAGIEKISMRAEVFTILQRSEADLPDRLRAYDAMCMEAIRYGRGERALKLYREIMERLQLGIAADEQIEELHRLSLK